MLLVSPDATPFIFLTNTLTLSISSSSFILALFAYFKYRHACVLLLAVASVLLVLNSSALVPYTLSIPTAILPESARKITVMAAGFLIFEATVVRWTKIFLTKKVLALFWTTFVGTSCVGLTVLYIVGRPACAFPAVSCIFGVASTVIWAQFTAQIRPTANKSPTGLFIATNDETLKRQRELRTADAYFAIQFTLWLIALIWTMLFDSVYGFSLWASAIAFVQVHGGLSSVTKELGKESLKMDDVKTPLSNRNVVGFWTTQLPTAFHGREDPPSDTTQDSPNPIIAVPPTYTFQQLKEATSISKEPSRMFPEASISVQGLKLDGASPSKLVQNSPSDSDALKSPFR